MNDIIEVNKLTKRYGDFTAVDGISFSVREGETFGILGPNGAGKTTTLEMMEGLKHITAGTVRLAGHDAAAEAQVVKSLIGVQLQASSFFDGLNLIELIETFAALYGRSANAQELLRQVELEEKSGSMVKELSGGQKQRLSIAVALVNDPKVIFLDEPTTGLDPQARRHLWDLIEEIKKQGKTVVLTTHYMDEAEVLCDRIAIMDHAKIVALDTTPNLLRFAGLHSSIRFRVDKAVDVSLMRTLPAAEEAVKEDHVYRVITGDPQLTLPSLFVLAHEQGSTMFDLELRQPTLEDVFLKLTGRTLRE